MFSSSAFIYVLTIIISFSIGILYYLLMEEETNELKRASLDVFISQLINFILYMWLAKILLRLPTFVKDPLAVLAYPSNSKVFYLATVFIFIHILMKLKHRKDRLHLIRTMIPVFFVAHFLFEFIQTVVIGMKPNWTLLVFYMLLAIVYTLLNGKVRQDILLRISVYSWIVGQMILAIFTKVSIFGYSVGLLYLLALLILTIGITLYSRKTKINI